MPGLQTPTDTSSDLHHLPVSCASGELTQEQLNWAAAANSRHSVHSRGVRRFNPFPLTPAKRPLAQHRARAPGPARALGMLSRRPRRAPRETSARPPPAARCRLLLAGLPGCIPACSAPRDPDSCPAPAPPPPAACAAAAATRVQPP